MATDKNQQNNNWLSKQFKFFSLLFICCILFGSIHISYVNRTTQDEILNNLQEAIQNIGNALQNICPPNSYFKNGLCYCNEGLAWNVKGDRCVTYNEACQDKYGPHTYGDKNYCYCEKGYVWNFNKTKCITKWESITQYFVGENKDIFRRGLLISIFLGLIPILIWSIIFLSIFKRQLYFKWLLILFSVGILITPLVYYGEVLLKKLLKIDLSVDLSLLSIIIVYSGNAIIEELAKFFSASFILKKNKYFDEAIDAMVYLIILALGFGLVENILASSQEISEGNLLLSVLQTLSLRLVGANLLHAVASGIIGYFWALKLIYQKKKFLYQGLFFGILLHASFNIASIKFGGPAVFFVSLGVFLEAIFLLWAFDSLKNIKN